jgi:hypothetical protein
MICWNVSIVLFSARGARGRMGLLKRLILAGFKASL